MARHLYPGDNKPKARSEGRGAVVIAIPKRIRDEIELEGGEEPEDIEYDPGAREVSFRFGGSE